MSTKFTELHCKEVICICDGRRLGYISDVCVDVCSGSIASIVVPGPSRFFGLLGRRDDYIIPWCKICRMGPDTVLVDAKPEECRVQRRKQGLFL